MSLDVTLYLEYPETRPQAIYIREDGEAKEIGREEWDARFPGVTPSPADSEYTREEVYTANITHNLNTMADHAGIYEELWRPDELGVTLAAELIEPLGMGLVKLEKSPSFYQQFNPKNGWGDYDGLVRFVSKYLAACKKYPQATIRISR